MERKTGFRRSRSAPFRSPCPGRQRPWPEPVSVPCTALCPSCSLFVEGTGWFSRRSLCLCARVCAGACSRRLSVVLFHPWHCRLYLLCAGSRIGLLDPVPVWLRSDAAPGAGLLPGPAASGQVVASFRGVTDGCRPGPWRPWGRLAASRSAFILRTKTRSLVLRRAPVP